MNEEQKAFGKRKRLRTFRLWLVLLAALFLGLLAATQFLPGGTRSFSDWLLPLLFLFVVSLVTATLLISVWVVIRPPFSPRKCKRLAFAFAGLTVLIAMVSTIATLRKWMVFSSRFDLPRESAVNTQAAAPRAPEALGTNNVRVNVNASQIVRAASDDKLLSVYAARRVDGTLALLVINKSPHIVMNANLSITGFQPQSAVKVFSYGIPQDEAARTGIGSDDIAQTTLSGAATDFSCSFSPYSATVIVLSPSNAE